MLPKKRSMTPPPKSTCKHSLSSEQCVEAKLGTAQPGAHHAPALGLTPTPPQHPKNGNEHCDQTSPNTGPGQLTEKGSGAWQDKSGQGFPSECQPHRETPRPRQPALPGLGQGPPSADHGMGHWSTQLEAERAGGTGQTQGSSKGPPWTAASHVMVRWS